MAKTKVLKIEPGSIAEEAGICPGDELISVNGNRIKDVFDYRFYMADENVVMLFRDASGELYEAEIEKDEYEDIGIDFEYSLMDEDRACVNHCVFCFIDQMPPGMRDTLYFKDDDARLSFLTGNYVSLTNTGKNELARIVKYKMSPLNVSVHVTDGERRCEMLRNKNAGDILEKIKILVDGGIEVNAQIVLCPGLNDGEYLEKSLNDLAALGNGIRSVSVVPVGITKFRDGLYPLRLFTPEECAKVIGMIESKQNECRKVLGRSFVYAADEFYTKGNVPLPDSRIYDDFPQIENGVGMCSLFRDEVLDAIEKYEKIYKEKTNRRVIVPTGVAAYGLLSGLCDKIEKKFTNIHINCVKIINNYFGETITVSGLITGGDLTEQLLAVPKADSVIITENMLRHGERVFLDNVTVEDAEQKLDMKIIPCGDSGEDFVKKILGADE